MPATFPPSFVKFIEQVTPATVNVVWAVEAGRTAVDKATTDFSLNALLARFFYFWRQTLGLLPVPFHVEICPTAACPFRCSFCSYLNRNALRQSLSRRILDEIAEDLAFMGVPGVYLSGGGDPLVAAAIVSFIEKVALFASVAIQTNGVCLDRLLARGAAWFNANIDLISWSIYAHEAALLETICRAGRLFPHIQSNIKQAVAFRDAAAGVPPHLSGKVVLCRENHSSLAQLMEFARSFRLNTCHIVTVDNFEPGQDVALTADQLVSIKATPAKGDETIRRFQQSLDSRSPARNGVPNYTVLEGHTAIIETDGSVYLSIPSDGDPRYVIGNVNQQRFRDIWWSERHLEVRERLARESYPVSRDRHYSRDLAIHAFVTGKRGFPLKAADLTPERLRSDLRPQI